MKDLHHSDPMFSGPPDKPSAWPFLGLVIVVVLMVLAMSLSSCGGGDGGTIYNIKCYAANTTVLQIDRGKRTWWDDGYVYMTDLSSGQEYFVQGATCVFLELENE